MRAIIASDNQTISTKLRHALVQLGYECLINNVLAIEDAAVLLASGDRQPDLILLVLPEDQERSLQQLKRLSESSPARIIAVGPGSESRLILNAVHAGADDYLVETQDLYSQLSSFLARLTAKREVAAPNGRLTLVASVGGGCGASVVAGNLAVLVARERDSCALLDFDARSGDQAALFNLKPRHTLSELCHNIEGCDQNMLEQSLTAHDSGVQLLAAPQQLSDNQYLSLEALRRISRIARSTRAQVVVDLGSIADGGDTELLQTADEILLVFRRDFPSLRRLRLILEAWDEARIGRHVVQLVANSCGQSKKLPLSKIQAALRRDVVVSLPDARQELNISVDSGNPVVLEAPHSPVAKSIAHLGVQIGLLSHAGSTARISPRDWGQLLMSRMADLTRSVVVPFVAPACK